MSWWSRQHSRALVGVAFVLVALANLGLQVHSGQHGLTLSHAGTTTLFIADHGEPDPSLHLDNLAGTRPLACPGCLAQNQVGGSHLLALHGLDRPAVARVDVDSLVDRPFSRSVTGSSPRAPPFC